MGRRQILVGIALTVGLLVLVRLETAQHDPLAAARAKASELGVDLETCSITGGRYGNRLLGSYGVVELVENGGRGSHVTVEVTRWPFGPWQLAKFQRLPQARPKAPDAAPSRR